MRASTDSRPSGDRLTMATRPERTTNSSLASSPSESITSLRLQWIGRAPASTLRSASTSSAENSSERASSATSSMPSGGYLSPVAPPTRSTVDPGECRPAPGGARIGPKRPQIGSGWPTAPFPRTLGVPPICTVLGRSMSFDVGTRLSTRITALRSSSAGSRKRSSARTASTSSSAWRTAI